MKKICCKILLITMVLSVASCGVKSKPGFPKDKTYPINYPSASYDEINKKN